MTKIDTNRKERGRPKERFGHGRRSGAGRTWQIVRWLLIVGPMLARLIGWLLRIRDQFLGP